MSATPPGWYPDPQDPRAVRWFDGQAWTERRSPVQPVAGYPATGYPAGTPTGQPWPTGSVPTGGRSSSTRALVIVASVVGGFLLLGILAAIAIPVFLNQRQRASLAEVRALTCQELVDDSIAISQQGADDGQGSLVSITDPILIADERAALKVPPTGSKAYVMTCRGAGVLDSGSSTTVTVDVYLTSERQEWLSIHWE